MLKEDLRFWVPVFFFPQFLSSSPKGGKQFKFPKTKYDCLYQHVMTPEVHVQSEHNLGFASSSGFGESTWIALSSLGLQPGFFFNFSMQVHSLVFPSTLLHS